MDNDVFRKLNEELAVVTDVFHKNEIVGKQIERTQQSILNLSVNLDLLYEQLEREEGDVDRLKRLSFANFLHTILKDKNKIINQELNDIIRIKSKIDYMTYEVEEEKVSLQKFEKMLENTLISKQRYNELIASKKSLIKELLPEKWKEIEKRNDNSVRVKKKRKELYEALSVGKVTLEKVKAIEELINNTSNWRKYNLLGGGALATLAKRNYMNEAQNKVHDLQYSLKTYNEELKDIGQSISVDIGIEGFLEFTDWIFDSFFVDWAVQSRISDEKEQLNQLELKINQLQKSIQKEIDENTDRIEELDILNMEQISNI